MENYGKLWKINENYGKIMKSPEQTCEYQYLSAHMIQDYLLTLTFHDHVSMTQFEGPLIGKQEVSFFVLLPLKDFPHPFASQVKAECSKNIVELQDWC